MCSCIPPTRIYIFISLTTIFYKNCTDKEKIADVNKIVKSLAQLKKYSSFPSLDAIDYQNRKIDVLDQPFSSKMC